MGTSQSAVARLETGEVDIRLSTLERYAAAVGNVIDWHLGTVGLSDVAAGPTFGDQVRSSLFARRVVLATAT